MKKLFFAVLATVAMVACTTDELVSVKGGDAIAFEDAFIDNATRVAVDPSLTTGNINGIDVWAIMDEYNGAVFSGEDVTKTGGVWTYANTQYWLPGHDYYFSALAPMNDPSWSVALADNTAAAELGIGTVSFDNTVAEGGVDLVYGRDFIQTATELTAAPGTVKFELEHLLSKVKFTFVNGFSNSNTVIKVTDIRMTAPATGTIDLAVADYTKGWVPSTTTTTLEFGNVPDLEGTGATDECATELFTIPAAATQKYTITFDAELLMGGVSAIVSDDLTAMVEGVELEMGKAYNFKATLDNTNISENGTELFPIVFEVVEVKDWVNGGEVVAKVNTVDPVVITDGQTFDGNGSTIAASAGRENNKNAMIAPEGDVTIKNVTVDGNNQKTETNQVMRGIYIKKGGEYNIDNVEIINCGYSINVTTTEAVVLNVTNSLLQSWISWSASTTATFNNVEFTPGQYAIMRPQGNATFTNCEFVAGFKFSLDLLVGTLTFTNCTYDGAPFTTTTVADNIDTTYYGSVAADANLTKVVIN